MKKEIQAVFVWKDRSGTVIRKERRQISMQIVIRDDKRILQFIGGPTGHESYYADDLFKHQCNPDNDLFYINVGTDGSWPSCRVSISEVREFLEEK